LGLRQQAVEAFDAVDGGVHRRTLT
jgi:hypothetical protein